ncbi:hypothetical protein FB451DRAFT_1460918 [Mycena latifolia]|nr:hypothetical protein FB451DRAFT_1460918 [Mycena latifolia]
MKLNIAALLASAAIMSPLGALADVTVSAVVTSLTEVTTLSDRVITELTPITNKISGDEVSKVSVTVTERLADLIAHLGESEAAIKGTPEFGDEDAQQILAEFNKFVISYKAGLNTLSGKHGIFGQFDVTGPLLSVLQSLEDNINTYLFGLIDLLPTQRAALEKTKDDLDALVHATITTYQETCFSNPFYGYLGFEAICH